MLLKKDFFTQYILTMVSPPPTLQILPFYLTTPIPTIYFSLSLEYNSCNFKFATEYMPSLTVYLLPWDSFLFRGLFPLSMW